MPFVEAILTVNTFLIIPPFSHNVISVQLWNGGLEEWIVFNMCDNPYKVG